MRLVKKRFLKQYIGVASAIAIGYPQSDHNGFTIRYIHDNDDCARRAIQRDYTQMRRPRRGGHGSRRSICEELGGDRRNASYRAARMVIGKRCRERGKSAAESGIGVPEGRTVLARVGLRPPSGILMCCSLNLQ